MFYTHADQTEKKYAVAKAIAAAKTTLLERHNIHDVCLDSVSKIDVELNKSITLKELNEMSDKIVDDSVYWAAPRQRRA